MAKKIFKFMSLLFLSFTGFVASSMAEEATLTPAKLQVAYVGKQGPQRFEFVSKYFEQEKKCKICEIRDVSVYLPEGGLDKQKTLDRWEKEKFQFPIILMDWNEKLTEDNKSFLEFINKQVAAGTNVVISAGWAENQEPTLAINKTLAAQISQALILSEMNERERILPNSYYGPELLTALKVTPNLAGQNMAPVVFVTRWVAQWTKKNQYEWPAFLKSRKEKTKKIWPSLDDFFGQ